MDAIAHWGQGHGYLRLTSCLSRASLLQTILVSRGLIEQPFQPVPQAEHELLRGP